MLCVFYDSTGTWGLTLQQTYLLFFVSDLIHGNCFILNNIIF